MNVKWSAADRQYIWAFRAKKDKELAMELSRIKGYPISVNALRKVRRSLGITKKGGRPPTNSTQ